MFSSLPKTNFNSLLTFILSSANTLNLDQLKILSFCKGLSTFFSKIRPILKDDGGFYYRYIDKEGKIPKFIFLNFVNLPLNSPHFFNPRIDTGNLTILMEKTLENIVREVEQAKKSIEHNETQSRSISHGD